MVPWLRLEFLQTALTISRKKILALTEQTSVRTAQGSLRCCGLKGSKSIKLKERRA
jgi:hypothetical protein